MRPQAPAPRANVDRPFCPRHPNAISEVFLLAILSERCPRSQPLARPLVAMCSACSIQVHPSPAGGHAGECPQGRGAAEPFPCLIPGIGSPCSVRVNSTAERQRPEHSHVSLRLPGPFGNLRLVMPKATARGHTRRLLPALPAACSGRSVHPAEGTCGVHRNGPMHPRCILGWLEWPPQGPVPERSHTCTEGKGATATRRPRGPRAPLQELSLPQSESTGARPR